jgi:HEAT repeat protein
LLRSVAVDPDKSDDAVTALVALGKAATPGLRAGLSDSNEDARLAAVDALGKIGGGDVVEPLLTALNDASWNVRLNAVQALGQLRSRRAVQPLLQLYAKDDDPQVRYECLTSLGLIGDPAAAGVLVAGTSSKDPYVRMWAMDALCEMRDAHASTLAAGLLTDPNVYVRRQVLRSCPGALDSSEGQDALLHVALTDSDFECTVWARRHLTAYVEKDPGGGQLRQKVLAEGLKAMQGKQPVLAALVVGDLGDPRATDELIRALHDPNPFIRHHAAYELGKIGERRAVPALIRTLQDPEALVAATAYNSLQWFAAAGDHHAQQAVKDYKGQKFDHPLPKM